MWPAGAYGLVTNPYIYMHMLIVCTIHMLYLYAIQMMLYMYMVGITRGRVVQHPRPPGGLLRRGNILQGLIDSGMGTSRAGDVEGTPTQNHVVPSMLAYEGLAREGQGQNLALTALYMLY